MSDTFPLLLKEGWPDHFLIMMQILIPAGVVDFKMFHNSPSSDMELFLSDDPKNLRSFPLKKFWFLS
jgi:hypothetical protein